MANSSKGGRGRSRKRRRAGTTRGKSAATATVEATPATAPAARARAKVRPQEPAGRGFKDPQSLGERPQAPWHPFPLSELLILVGAIATIVAFSKLKHGLASGGATLVVGVVAVLLGTVEFTLREHRSGYRSHTILLAAIPAVVVYTGTLLVLSAFVSPIPAALKAAPLVLALPTFALLFKLLRGRFQDARRERVFAGER
ncbi:MAG: hypothetical protein QOF54_581 [Solirubrobacteraceae bacterium]|nr:hypothetical protein [Solirubrobacterales bacterium]MEA2208104.1 hypothetical protein [Solirubrobacteraceae bacterium]